jgi:hypothetical protein
VNRRRHIPIHVTIALLLATCGEASGPVIVLDQPNIISFAKITCQQASRWEKEHRRTMEQGCDNFNSGSCSEWMPIVQSCSLYGVEQIVRSFEDEIVTQLSTNTACAGVSIAKDTIEWISKPHWDLLIDVIPGARAQTWRMIHLVNHVSTTGEGSPKEILRGREAPKF